MSAHFVHGRDFAAGADGTFSRGNDHSVVIILPCGEGLSILNFEQDSLSAQAFVVKTAGRVRVWGRAMFRLFFRPVTLGPLGGG
jgi:hypothetical protein